MQYESPGDRSEKAFLCTGDFENAFSILGSLPIAHSSHDETFPKVQTTDLGRGALLVIDVQSRGK